MARKLNKNLVALGSAAILTVYAAGFARTGSSSLDATAGTPAAGAVASGTPVTGSNASTAVARAIAASAAASYRDGTYTGTGTSRFGNITAAVTIQNGAITSATITRATTSYPVSRISKLPGQVVARQSANVDLVSGATYSARAFKDAVAQALAQAAVRSVTTTSGQG